jgi:hypothetical protein
MWLALLVSGSLLLCVDSHTLSVCSLLLFQLTYLLRTSTSSFDYHAFSTESFQIHLNHLLAKSDPLAEYSTATLLRPAVRLQRQGAACARAACWHFKSSCSM